MTRRTRVSGRRARPFRRGGLWGAGAALGLLALAALALVFGFSGGRGSGLDPGEARISFLDSGMSDCSVIEAGGGVVMIDCGDSGSAGEILGFLEDRGIDAIDLLFITHPHADHYGSAVDILESCRVEQVVFTSVPDSLQPTADGYFQLLDTLERLDTPVEIASVGQQYQLELGCIRVLWAGEEDCEDLNACSLVLRYDYGRRAALFMGDAEFSVEKKLMESGAELWADILKAGHHGSRYATSADFLSAVGPGMVVALCGLDNQYGFPSEEFIQRVQEAGAVLYRTDTGGSISFVTDGNYLRSEA